MSISEKKTLFECFFGGQVFYAKKTQMFFSNCITICVCLFVFGGFCLFVCMFAFVCVCSCLFVCVCLFVCLYLSICLRLFVYVCLCLVASVCLCVCLRLFVLTFVFVHACLFACVLKVRFNIWLLRNMKGAREQLLDIKSKTQYQSSRCMEQCDTHPHCTREVCVLCRFMRTRRQYLLAKMLSLPYIYS